VARGVVLAVGEDDHRLPAPDSRELEQAHDHRVIKRGLAVGEEREQRVFEGCKVGGERREEVGTVRECLDERPVLRPQQVAQEAHDHPLHGR